ncbi:MAG TPA: NAD(+)/NADH kinase [Gammaproteobacteria bacterium]|nr:NAD(+)/NADH kinase [Gammaproteobacteria bacterium]
MANRFKRIGLWGRFSEGSLAEPARQLIKHLNERRIEVFASDGNGMLADAGKIRFLPEAELGGAIDLLVAIGGDGNLLRATRCVAGHSVPLIGVNRGRLGFLTDVKPEQMLAALDAVFDGDYLAEERLMLMATIKGKSGESDSLNALNDVVLQRDAYGQILDFVTTVDGHYVNKHGGDGLIVATPTGSTAYALSCGGPIIRPDVAALVMVPICPHTLSDRPLVIQSSSTIVVEVPPGAGEAHVTCDGEKLGSLDETQQLEIAAANETVTLLHPKDYDYYELLRSKLNWGRANRAGN